MLNRVLYRSTLLILSCTFLVAAACAAEYSVTQKNPHSRPGELGLSHGRRS